MHYFCGVQSKMIFENIRERHLQDLSRLKKHIAWLSVARLSLFVATVAAVYFTFGLPIWPIVSGLIGVAAFLYVVRLHASHKERREHSRHAVTICEEELARFRGEWRSMDGGEKHIDPSHPFTYDLGVFGHHSLYQYTNRTRSAAAARLWADMLGENLTDRDAILREREYIRALSTDMDFAVEYLARSSQLHADDQNFEAVRRWSAGEKKAPNKGVEFAVTRLLPVYSIAATAAYAIGVLSGTGYLWLMLLPALVIFSRLGHHQKVFGQFDAVLGSLPAYEGMLARLRRRAERDATLRERWKRSNLEDSEEALARLRSIAGAMDSRNNIFVSIALNLLLLWDFQVAKRLRRWREEHAADLPKWLELTASVEAYLSPAVYVHNHPDFTYPEFVDDFAFRMDEVRHVLLDEDAVPNDLKLEGTVSFSIITGANMAGKSTYLRTVGTTLLLAMRGLPVAAKSVHLKPTRLFTSMLTSDSLGEGESYFFSELKRLKQLTDILERDQPLFVILDEILKGTNSKDKAVGSKKFLAKLLSLPAKGLVATHDLSLCEIVDTFPDRVVNHSFEVTFRDDELHFDYCLRPGVSENMNAAFLLRKMGLTREEDA